MSTTSLWLAPTDQGSSFLQSARESQLQHDLREAQGLAKLGTRTYNRGILALPDKMHVLHDRDSTLGLPSLKDGFSLFTPPSAASLDAAISIALKTAPDSRWTWSFDPNGQPMETDPP